MFILFASLFEVYLRSGQISLMIKVLLKWYLMHFYFNKISSMRWSKKVFFVQTITSILQNFLLYFLNPRDVRVLILPQYLLEFFLMRSKEFMSMTMGITLKLFFSKKKNLLTSDSFGIFFTITKMRELFPEFLK